MAHTWVESQIKMFGKTMNRPSRKSGTHRKRKPSPRRAFVCAGCNLTALPPKSGKRANGWNPPVGDCK